MSRIEPFEPKYNNQYLEVFGCQHTSQKSYSDKVLCAECGIFINNPNTRVYKTLKMKFNAFFNPISVLSNILSEGQPAGPTSQRQQVIDFLLQASERLNLTANTTFLAIVFLDEYFSKTSVHENQIFLYAATALMLAAKSQELDERIPFISKLKRYASMTSHPEINTFTTLEYKLAEKSLIQTLEWKLQKVTLLDRIEALLSFGVIDDDDSLGQQQQKENKGISTPNQHIKLRDLSELQILSYVKEVETKYIDIAFQILRDEQLYFQTDQSILALSSIAYLRKKAGLLNIWSQQLQQLTGVSAQKISSSVSQIMTLIAKCKSFKTINTFSPQSTEIFCFGTPQNIPTLTNVNTNHLITSRPYCQLDNKRKSFGDVAQNYKSQIKIPTIQNGTTVQLETIKSQQSMKNINFCTANNYSYLNDNQTHQPKLLQQFTMFNPELDKKYEQVHKVSGNMFKQIN